MHRKVLDVPAVKVQEVHPMPPPGILGNCRAESMKLMFDLRKDRTIRDQLRFVALDQGGGCGIHFVVEDDISVYDTSCRFENLPRTTRVTKETYWACNAKNITRLTNDQFQVLYDIMMTLQDLRGPETLPETVIKMKLVVALWGQGGDNETEDDRFARIATRVMPTKRLLQAARTQLPSVT